MVALTFDTRGRLMRLIPGFTRAALAICALLVVRANDASARGSRRQAAGYEAVALETIRGNPRAFIGKRVSFDGFFAGLGRIYQPFQTPFVPDQFVNFYVWEPEMRLWDNRERKNAFLFCYVPRDLDKQASYIMSREMYDAVRIYGRVLVVYVGQPWFEVEDIEPSDARNYTDLALKHILVGIKSLKNEDFPMAQQSFNEALRGRLPRTAQVFVQRELGRAYYELDMHTQAYKALMEAGAMDAWLALRSGQSRSRAADTERNAKRKKAMLNEALVLLRKARQLEPANPESHAEIGWVRAKLGEPREGILDCKRANALKQSASTYRILGIISHMIGKVTDAYNYYQQAIMLEPSSPRYHRELAGLYMKEGKFIDAETEYSNVVTLTPTEPRGYLMRAEARRRLGKTEMVIQDYEAALSQDSENIDALLGLTAVYVDSGDFASARHWISQAERLVPKNIRVRAARADMLRAQGALADAILEYRDIIKQNPKGDLALVHYLLGQSLYVRAEKGDLGAAANELKMAARMNPEHAKTRKVLAKVYADQGKYGLAVNHLLEARKLEPGDETTRLMLADVLAENNQIDEALRELSKLITEQPESTYARNNRAYLLAEFGKPTDLPEALELAKEAREKEPANPDFLDTLGWVKYRLQDKDEGRILIESAVINSKEADAFYHLALIAAESDETTIAIENIEEAIRRVREISGKGHVARHLEDEIENIRKKVGASRNPSPRGR